MEWSGYVACVVISIQVAQKLLLLATVDMSFVQIVEILVRYESFLIPSHCYSIRLYMWRVSKTSTPIQRNLYAYNCECVETMVNN